MRSLLPEGLADIVRPQARAKFVLSVLGSLATAVLDLIGVAALLPLMQLLTGEDRGTGVLGWVSRALGTPSDTRLAVTIGAFIVVAFGVKGLLTLAFRWWQLGFLAKEAVWAATSLLRGYLRGPYVLHLQRPVAGLMRTMGDAVAQTYSGVVNGLLTVVAESATIVCLGVLLVVTNPLPAVVAFVYLGTLAWLLARATRSRSSRAGDDILEASMESFKASLHALGGVKEITMRDNAEVFVGRFRRSQLALVDGRRRVGFIADAPKYVLELAFIAGVAILAVVTLATQGPGPAVGSLAVFVAAGFRILPSVMRLMSAVTGIQSGLPGFVMVRDDLQRWGVAEAVPPTSPPPPPQGDLVVDHVSYSYPDSDVPALVDVTVDVPRGTSLAVVGPSGSGKSTLVNVILGLLPPTSGRVTVGGCDIQEQLKAWQSSIGLVPQVVFAYDGTLRDNVAFGANPDEVDDERLTTLLRQVELGALLAERGLDTAIGDRGIGVSGGQQQRIGLARALYHRPGVLVLDEATSALDNITEHRITQTIGELRGDVTTIVVAHRLSTVRHCDRLILLEDGRLTAAGTFEEVRARSGTFAQMVELGTLDPRPEVGR